MVELRADCSRCFGLCCVVPGFARSSDFAIDKSPNTPCPNLLADFRCGIHENLRERGFPGCTVYDCFGAGQRVAQDLFGGTDWRAAPEAAEPMFQAFRVVRDLHELLWYLTGAAGVAEGPLRDELRAALAHTERLAGSDAGELAGIDVAAHRGAVDALLRRASEQARAGYPEARQDFRRADLIGKNLTRDDLRGADLRGALLLGADLRGTDLARADLIGADLRGTDLRGADLGRSLFLTQFQVNAAVGDQATVLPPGLDRPPHWR